MASTMHGGEHAGWIYKQGSMIKNWKKRFMVLRGKQLAYYDTERINPRVKEKGSFQVITVELSSDIRNGLIVHGRGGRVLKLYTDTAEATNGWYHAIMDATSANGPMAAERMSDRFSSLSGSNNSESVDLDDQLDLLGRLESLPLDEPQVQHSGWLTKEGSRVKSWKKRFFTLRGDTLSYFDSAGTGSNAKGYGHVRAVEVDDEKPHTLAIRLDNGRILRVSAESGADMQEWLCMISDAIEAAQMDNNHARQSLAIRQSLRASMSAPKPPRPAGSTPLRHSLAGVPSSSSAAPVRPTLVGPIKTPQQLEQRRADANSSYLTSYSAQSSTISSDNQSGNSFYDSDDSDGDWI